MNPTNIASEITNSIDPLYFRTKALIAFLQLIFSKREEGQYRYIDDDKSEILIGDQNSLMAEKIPRIVVVRGPTQIIPLMIDNLLSRKDKTGNQVHSLLIGIPFGINVIAKIGLEAQEMAFYIVKNILANRSTLRKVGKFHKIDSNITISPETGFNSLTTPETRPEANIVQIGLNTIIPYEYNIEPIDKPLLTKINVNQQ